MSLAEVAVTDGLSFACYNREGNLVQVAISQDFASEVQYEECTNEIMQATSAFEATLYKQVLEKLEKKKGLIAELQVGCIAPAYQSSGIFELTYWALLDIVKARGFRYATGFFVSPKMVRFSKKLVDQMFEGEWKFMKYADFEFNGERPLSVIVFDSQDYGVDDGALTQYLDLTMPKRQENPLL